MKRDEDLGRDRGDDFQTDDEENLAERSCDNGYDTYSDNSTPPSHNLSACSIEGSNPSWPQSYRGSIDMLTSPSISFMQGTSLAGITSSLTSMCKRRLSPESASFLTKPLICHQNSEKQEVPTSTLPLKSSASSQSKFSLNELTQTNKESSFAQAVINGINILCGIGLLTTPYAVNEGGWLSLLILALFGFLYCYTGKLLKDCLESTPGLRTYPDIGQAAFGVAGRLTISIMLYFELYAACVEYVIMMSDNLSTLFPNTFMSLAGKNLDSHEIFALIATIVVLPTVWLRDLSLLSYLSVGGVGASILVAFCLLWVGTVDKVGFHHNGTALDLAKLPFAVGIYGYGFSGHAVFPNIYSSMKEPSGFTSVLIISFIFCWFMYTGVAICGFLMFGDTIKSQFTLNMPTELMASKIASWTAIVNPMTKYALTMTPVALSLEELMPSGWLRSYGVSLIIRTILVMSTLVVAQRFPFFGFMMAFIGSSLAMLSAVIFPCACYLRILHGKLTKLQIAACLFTITVGLLTACLGTYSSVARMADKLV
ncbi:amino acid transporter AVT1D isoform X1 [Ricinus communis]|uniref:amino acid transporter AVT1D isoform X1 n=1 Tax=Ricinus communis TaxID=3988 RepID=UPI00201B2042|nr:amino acid transporter AVT1D isoform X1 [Ricinus communis]